MLLIIVFVVVSLAFGSPIGPEIVVELGQDVVVGDAPDISPFEKSSMTHAYAVDVSESPSRSQMDCLRLKGYQALFLRAFKPIGNGSFDGSVVEGILNANRAGLGVEVFITPKFESSLSADDQISLVYQSLIDSRIEIRSIWIQVTSPTHWQGLVSERISFIEEMVRRAKELGLIVGIYTNAYDWEQITNNWKTVGNDVLLWYWHVLGAGPDAESTPNLDDFRPFGPWNYASVKQFAQTERLCDLIVNRNVYPSKVAKLSQKLTLQAQNSSKLLIGSIGL